MEKVHPPKLVGAGVFNSDFFFNSSLTVFEIARGPCSKPIWGQTWSGDCPRKLGTSGHPALWSQFTHLHSGSGTKCTVLCVFWSISGPNSAKKSWVNSDMKWRTGTHRTPAVSRSMLRCEPSLKANISLTAMITILTMVFFLNKMLIIIIKENIINMYILYIIFL